MTSFLDTVRQLRAHWQTQRIPAGQRVYAVGDIHGCADLLEDLHARIGQDLDTHAHDHALVIYLGDYIDRGLASRDVLELLCRSAVLPKTERIFLKGNHEDALLRFLNDPIAGAPWLSVGGDATAYSYGIRMSTTAPQDDELVKIAKDLQRAMPNSHLSFLNSLRLSYRIGGYYFVHAGVRPRVPLAEQSEQDLLWIREEFTESLLDHGARIVHGHSVAYEMEVRRNRIGVDTGAFATGRLTALVLHDENISSLATG